MNKTEALKLVFTVKSAYPVYYRNVSDTEFEMMADLWQTVLSEYSFNDAFTAIQTYLRSGKKEILQSPGQIVDEIERLKETANPDFMTPAEAWEIIRPAIHNGNYGAEQEFEKFPPIIKKAVGSPKQLKTWAGMHSETIDSVEKSNFCNRTFPAIINRMKDENRMPASVKALIEHTKEQHAIAEKKRIAEITEKQNEPELITDATSLDHSDERHDKIHEEIMRRREERKHKTATAKEETA